MIFIGGPLNAQKVVSDVPLGHVIYVRANPYTVATADDQMNGITAANFTPYIRRTWRGADGDVECYVVSGIGDITMDHEMRKAIAAVALYDKEDPRLPLGAAPAPARAAAAPAKTPQRAVETEMAVPTFGKAK